MKTLPERIFCNQTARDLMQLSCWEWDTRLPYWRVDEGFWAILGRADRSGDQLLIDDLQLFTHPDDHMLLSRQLRLMSTGQPTNFRLRTIDPHGAYHYLHLVSAPLAAPENAAISEGFCRNITTEYHSSAVLYETVQELEREIKTYKKAELIAQAGTWQVNLNTHEVYYSEKVFQLHGLNATTGAMHLNTFAGFVHPDDKAVVTRVVDNALQQKIEYHLSYRIIRSDGALRYLQVVSEVTRGFMGEELLVGIVQDVTEQRLVEQELQQVQDQLRMERRQLLQAEQALQAGSWQINIDTLESECSENLWRILGLKPSPTGRWHELVQPFVFPDDRRQLDAAMAEALAGELPGEMDFRITRRDGKLRHLRQYLQQVVTPQGRLLMGLVQDITPQQQLQDALETLQHNMRIQQETMALAEQAAPMGSWRRNLSTGEVWYADSVFRIYGLRPQVLINAADPFARLYHPDDADRIREIYGSMREQCPQQFEYRVYRADGELRYLRTYCQMITSDSGEQLVIGTTHDATEEMEPRLQLQEQSRLVQTLHDHLADQVVVTNRSHTITLFNKAAENACGISREAALGRNVFDVFPHWRTPEAIQALRKVWQGEQVQQKTTDAGGSPIGEQHHIPVKDNAANVLAAISLLRDVSEEFRQCQEYRQQFLFMERLLDAFLCRVMAVDTDLQYIAWNQAAADHYQRSREQVIGSNLLEFAPDFRKTANYQHLMAAMEGKTVHVPSNHDEKNGPFESYFIPLRQANQRVEGVLWIEIALENKQGTIPS